MTEIRLSTGIARVGIEVEGGAAIADAIPAGLRIPDVSEMAYGDEACDHLCDVEHEQQLPDGSRWLVSAVWTTDGGYGMEDLPEPMVGCQWLACVSRHDDDGGTWSDRCAWMFPEWVDVLTVALDCDPDTPDEEAIAAAVGALADAVAQARAGN